jgi:hypothetical protein
MQDRWLRRPIDRRCQADLQSCRHQSRQPWVKEKRFGWVNDNLRKIRVPRIEQVVLLLRYKDAGDGEDRSLAGDHPRISYLLCVYRRWRLLPACRQ